MMSLANCTRVCWTLFVILSWCYVGRASGQEQRAGIATETKCPFVFRVINDTTVMDPLAPCIWGVLEVVNISPKHIPIEAISWADTDFTLWRDGKVVGRRQVFAGVRLSPSKVANLRPGGSYSEPMLHGQWGSAIWKPGVYTFLVRTEVKAAGSGQSWRLSAAGAFEVRERADEKEIAWRRKSTSAADVFGLPLDKASDYAEHPWALNVSVMTNMMMAIRNWKSNTPESIRHSEAKRKARIEEAKAMGTGKGSEYEGLLQLVGIIKMREKEADARLDAIVKYAKGSDLEDEALYVRMRRYEVRGMIQKAEELRKHIMKRFPGSEGAALCRSCTFVGFQANDARSARIVQGELSQAMNLPLPFKGLRKPAPLEGQVPPPPKAGDNDVQW